MGIVNDITSLMRKGPELASQVNSIKMNTKSITKGAKDSTFQFPCLVVNTIPFDMANTVARTLDQVYASFTQTWLSMNSMFDITIDPTPLSYLAKLHQNLKLESVESDDIDKYMERVYDGSYRLYMTENKDFGVLFNVSDNNMKTLYENNKDLLSEYMSEFNMAPIEVTEAEAPTSKEFADAIIQGQINKNSIDAQGARAKITEKSTAPRLVERDLKKANDLVPYGIQVRLIAVNDKKEFVQYVDFIVGVKTVLHLIESTDMVENIARALQNKSTLFKLLKWTTGEISLVKDIILNIDDVKMDIINKTSGKSPFFGTLKRLKNKKVGTRNLTVPHALIPNATICISSLEADLLESRYGINVRDRKIAKKLIDSLFLMSFIILDEGSNSVSVFYDGDSDFQIYALETLERDNSLNSNRLGKEIGRMISH